MRAFLRTVTGSPRPALGSRTSSSTKQKVSHQQLVAPAVEQVVRSWHTIREILEPPQATTSSSKVLHRTAQQDERALEVLGRALDSMVDVLVTEASLLSSSETTGECIEYILTNDILGALVRLAIPDNRPQGALRETLRAFNNLVTLLGDNFIAFSHRPIVSLIDACAGADTHSESGVGVQAGSSSKGKKGDMGTDERRSARGRYDKELTSLLCSICARLKAHCELLPIFFYRQDNRHHSHRTRASVSGPQADAIRKTLHIAHSPPAFPATSPSVSANFDPFTPASAPSASTTLSSDADQSAGDDVLVFPIFSLLLTYLARPGQIGEFARQALLFLVELAAENGGESASMRRLRRRRQREREKRHTRRSAPSGEDEGGFRTPGASMDLDEDACGFPFTSPSVAVDGIEDTSLGAEDGKTLHLASYILASGFADVLGASLGAAFGLLPRKVYIPFPASNAFTLVSNGGASGLEGDKIFAESRLETLHDEGCYLVDEQEVKDQLRFWLDLVMFAQDVLRRIHSARTTGIYAMAQSMPKLATKLLDSIRVALLENTLYPILLETFSPSAFVEPASIVSPVSQGHGETSPPSVSDTFESMPSPTTGDSKSYAVLAILTYLDNLFHVLDPGVALADVVMAFLMGEDHVDHPNTQNEDTSVESARPDNDIGHLVSTPLKPSVSNTSSASNRSRLSSTKGLLELQGQANTPRHFSSSTTLSATLDEVNKPSVDMQRWNSGLSIVLPDEDASSRIGKDPQAAIEKDRKISLKALIFNLLAPVSSGSSGRSTPSLRATVLRLLHTTFLKFDAASLELLDGVPHLGATLFPFDVRSVLEEEERSKAEDEGQFRYPGQAEDEDSDAESFVYPDAISKTAKNVAKVVAIDTRPDPPTSEMAILLKILYPPKPDASEAHEEGRTGVQRSASASTDYASYLRDAELSITRDASFQRGLAILSRLPRPTVGDGRGLSGVLDEVSTVLSSEFSSGAPSSLSGQSDPVLPKDKMLQHTLLPATSPLLATILDSLCSFFTNSSEENLLLTAILARLASCPYRSLTGWLLPLHDQLKVLEESQIIARALDARTARSETHLDQDGETHKPLIPLFLLSKSAASPVPTAPHTYGSDPAITSGTASLEQSSKMPVFGILLQLSDMVDLLYSKEINGFNRYLEERRKGMVFAEDLAEALDFPADEAREQNAAPGTPSRGPASRAGMSAPSIFGTPNKGVSLTKGSKGATLSVDPVSSAHPGVSEGLSPYAAHYARTEGIRVSPRKAVSPAGGSITISSPKLTWRSDDEEDADVPADVYTPTRPGATSQAAGKYRALGHRAKTPSISSIISASKRKRQSADTVSLSSLLDNVIILEETIKELVAIVGVRRKLGIDDVAL